MFKTLTLAVAISALIAPAAYAQDSSGYEDEDRDGHRDSMGEERLRDAKSDRDGDRHGRWGGRSEWRRHAMRPGRSMAPPPPPPSAGFEMQISPGRTLSVRCGDEALSDCIDAIQPLLDELTAPPPPPPGDAEASGMEPMALDKAPPPSPDAAPSNGAASPEAGPPTPPPPLIQPSVGETPPAN